MSGAGPFLDVQANGTSDANGNVTLTFPAVPSQQNWQGIVSVPNATPGSQWTVLVNGKAVGTITGTNAYGAFGLSGGASLSLVGSGVANTQYAATMHGQFLKGPTAQNIVTPSPQANSINALESADLLAGGNASLPAAGTRVTAGNVVSAKQTYMSVALVVSCLNGSTTTPITIAASVQNGFGWRFQTKALRKIGADNSFYLVFYFPLWIRPGDLLSVAFIGVDSGNTAFPIPITWGLYGLTSSVLPEPLRGDGRCMPIGNYTIGNQFSPNGVGSVLIAAPPPNVRILLASLSAWSGMIANTPFASVAIAVTINGGAVNILWAASGSQGGTLSPGLIVPNAVPAEGILCDPATQMLLQVPGGGSPVWSAFPTVQATFDLVA